MNTPLDLGNSLLVTVIGMSIVFLGLVILIFLIKLLASATERMGGKKKRAAAAQPPVPQSYQIQPQKPTAVEEIKDSAVIAAIVAAVACCLEEEGSHAGFTVRHVRRIHHAPAFQQAGRSEQLRNRF